MFFSCLVVLGFVSGKHQSNSNITEMEYTDKQRNMACQSKNLTTSAPSTASKIVRDRTEETDILHSKQVFLNKDQLYAV
jgi:hypothetical protein